LVILERRMSSRVAVSSAEFIRNIGHWQSEAMRQPISITHHGRERLVLAASDQFVPGGSPEISMNAEIAAAKAANAALLESMEDGFLSFDAHARITGANGTAEAFVGAPRDTLLGRMVYDVLPDPMAAMLADRLTRVLRARHPESFECGAFDGRYASIRVFPLPAGAGALLHNLTEQHALRREREAHRALDAALRGHDGIAALQLDAHGRIEAVADAFSAWSDFSCVELKGHRFADLISAGARRTFTIALEGVLRERKPARTEITLIGKRGDELRGSAAIAPILSDFVARGAQLVLTRTAGAHTCEAR
jgi:PAS domain S-box-containing protein